VLAPHHFLWLAILLVENLNEVKECPRFPRTDGLVIPEPQVELCFESSEHKLIASSK